MPSFYKIAAAVTGAALLAGELVIGVLSLRFPHESQRYKDFYITHSRDCWLPADADKAAAQALSQPEIDPGKLDAQAACYVFSQGWTAYPPWGETGEAKTAWASLPLLPGAKALELTLANTSLQYAQAVAVGLDGQPVARLALPPGGATVTLRLPVASGSQMRIRFDRTPAADGKPMAVLRVKWIQQ